MTYHEFFNEDQDELYLKVDEVPTEAEAREVAARVADQWWGEDAAFEFDRLERGVPIHQCDDWQDKTADLDDMSECDTTKCGFFDVWTFQRRYATPTTGETDQ